MTSSNSLSPRKNQTLNMLKLKTDIGKKKLIDNHDEKKTLSEENADNIGKVKNIKINGKSFFKSTEVMMLKNTKINQGVLQGLNVFHRKHQHGFIDVWWLFDDGGKYSNTYLQLYYM